MKQKVPDLKTLVDVLSSEFQALLLFLLCIGYFCRFMDLNTGNASFVSEKIIRKQHGKF